MTKLHRSLLVVGSLLTANTAFAGIFDTPLPATIFGSSEEPKLIYATTGLRTNGSNGSTTITCTNVGKADARVGVEYFDYDGTSRNDVTTGSTVSIAVGETKTMSADSVGSGSALLFESLIVTLTSDLDQGSARVLAAGETKLLCTAQVLNDVTGDVFTARMFSKGKQKGD